MARLQGRSLASSYLIGTSTLTCLPKGELKGTKCYFCECPTLKGITWCDHEGILLQNNWLQTLQKDQCQASKRQQVTVLAAKPKEMSLIPKTKDPMFRGLSSDFHTWAMSPTCTHSLTHSYSHTHTHIKFFKTKRYYSCWGRLYTLVSTALEG